MSKLCFNKEKKEIIVFSGYTQNGEEIGDNWAINLNDRIVYDIANHAEDLNQERNSSLAFESFVAIE